MKFLFYILSILLIFGCSRKPDKEDLINISKKSWVYTGGYKLGQGDFIDFDTDWYQLKDDSIFAKKIFKGKIIKYNSKYREITIKTADKKLSYYYNHDYK